MIEPPGRPEEPQGVLSPGRNHVAFRVDDLDAVRTRLQAAALEVMESPVGIRQMFVLSPGANVIEFIQP